MLNTSIKYLPPSVFNNNVRRIPAFSVSSSVDEISILVTKTTLNITTSNTSISYILKDYTVQSIIDSLKTISNVSVGNINQGCVSLNGSILLPGSGNTLYFTDKLLDIIMSISDNSTSSTYQQLDEMIKQLVITESEGLWSDYWGSYFDILRLTGESDSDYTRRIITDIFRPRSSKYALENIVEGISKKYCNIFEPWTKLCKLSTPLATLSSYPDPMAVLPNQDYWNFCTIDVQSPIYNTDIEKAINKNKSLGVVSYYSSLLEYTTDGSDSLDYSYNVDNIYTLSPRPTIFYLSDGNSRPLSGYTYAYADIVYEYIYFTSIIDTTLSRVYDQNGKYYDPGVNGLNLGFPLYAPINKVLELTPDDTQLPLYVFGDWPLATLIDLEYTFVDDVIYEQVILSHSNNIAGYTREVIDISGYVPPDSSSTNINIG